jgi:hypothetical protein
MPELRIRGVDVGVLAALRHQAMKKGITLQVEVKTMLAERASEPRRAAVERLRKLSDAIEAESGILPDSTPGIREERERRF